MREISFGSVDDTWRRYGLDQAYITIDGKDTSYKAIFRNNELIKVLGIDYYLFPNEEALEMANAAASLVGLEKFTAEVPGIKTEDHVMYSDNMARMRAMYVLGKTFRVDEEEVKVGVNIFNAIDGSSSFGCGLFTYRFICGNGSIVEKESVMSVQRIHTKGMETAIQDLKNKMVILMEKAADLLELYEDMAKAKVTDKLIDKILRSRTPARVLPDYIAEEEAELQTLQSGSSTTMSREQVIASLIKSRFD